ncbi:hypothetical protein D9Q98_008550 [Chlorella vulgaris]|uniref:Uncharacterized protein n=1 Tax=Chlorella vulgaris TaxID=3077 RepID=A0A9D4TI84_CHLVU|nr:hypothetical protein D9Q98_008550 [Chlorella vulgaris]
MGWVSATVVQGVVAFVILGTLKRAGVIKVETRAIEHPGVRSMFEQGVAFGESIATAGERIVNEFKRS